MSRSYLLFGCLGCLLILAVALPFSYLNAAELWNSRKKRDESSSSAPYTSKSKGTSKRSYYNSSKSSSTSNRTVLYNRQSTTYKSIKNGGIDGVAEAFRSYKNVTMRTQEVPEHWSYLSEQAMLTRQANTNRALKMEYETSKASAKYMIAVQKQMKAAEIQGDEEHQRVVAAYEAEQEAKDSEYQRKKDIALGRTRTSSRSSTRNRTGGSPKLYVTGEHSSRSSLGLKKPRRTFNDPNN